MIPEQRHLNQQWDLAEHEDRYDDCTRLSDAIHRHLDIHIVQSHNGQGQMTTPNRPHQQIKMQSGLPQMLTVDPRGTSTTVLS